jgi:hypothetical protein
MYAKKVLNFKDAEGQYSNWVVVPEIDEKHCVRK